MRIKRMLAAATDWRTLLLLAVGIIAAAALSNPFPAVVGLGLYLWAVQRVAQSPELQQAAERAAMAEALANRYRELQATMRAMNGRLPAIPLQGDPRPWTIRSQAVTNAAIAIYQAWLQQPAYEPEKVRWVEEALRLANSYLRILRVYHELHLRPGPRFDQRAVADRLQRNKARLAQTTDMEARSLLIQAIELDERVLRQGQEESAEAERYLAKLAAIESTLGMLRRRALEADIVEEEAHGVHELLLEAEAMDEALDEVQRRARTRTR